MAAYAGGKLGPLALRTGGAWSWNDIDTSRAVVFPGFFEREMASYDGDTGQVFGEVAYQGPPYLAPKAWRQSLLWVKSGHVPGFG